MFKQVLVPLDGSELAERAIGRVARWRAPEGTLHLVRVIPGSAGGEPTPFEEAQAIEAESYLEYVAGEIGGSVRTSVRRGPVAEEVLAAAKAASADAIAVSSHGESGVGRMVFGTVAGHVVRGAECPVLVFGPTAPKAPPAAGSGRAIVALDGTAESEAVLAPARALARDHGLSLVLVTVMEALWAAGDSALARVQSKEVRRTADRLKQLAAQLQSEGIAARTLLARGDAAGELLSQVERRKADLLCMSTRARGGVGRWFFGSVAESVVKSAPVPVLLVRRPAGSTTRAAAPPA